MARVASAIAALAFCALAAGCGFELRGEPSVGLHSIEFAGAVPSTVIGDIRRILLTGPTRVVTGDKDAEAILRILGESRDKTVHTITGTGRVYDFQLRIAVTFQLDVPGRGEPVIASTEVATTRLITYNEAAPTAKETEERLLYQDMQTELASRILRQVAVARREMPAAFAPAPQ